jgi:dTDP-4-amino-4,6-dideoxygalactose transaminase
MSKLAFLGGTPVRKSPFPAYNSLGKEETQAVHEVMASGVLSDFLGSAGDKFLGGARVRRFEQRFAKYFGVTHAVSFNSATTALQAALTAAGVGPGDQVITTPYTFTATAGAILLAGAVPVFADIDDTLCLSAASVEQCITPYTKAILAVNLFGGMPNYHDLSRIAKKHNLVLIEDNAQSPGASFDGKPTGTIGDIGVFSFNVHKVIQSGEGGVLITNNDKYAFRAQLARNHGELVVSQMRDHPFEPVVGSNTRMTELHAAIAESQLKKLRAANKQRRVLAAHLSRELKRFSWIESFSFSPKIEHVYHLYPMTFHPERIGFGRDLFIAAMKKEGFVLGGGYVTPLYLLSVYQERRMYPRSLFPFDQPGAKEISYQKGICPRVEWYWSTSLITSDLCQPDRSRGDMDQFVRALQKIEDNAQLLIAHEQKLTSQKKTV